MGEGRGGGVHKVPISWNTIQIKIFFSFDSSPDTEPLFKNVSRINFIQDKSAIPFIRRNLGSAFLERFGFYGGIQELLLQDGSGSFN